MGEVLDWLNVDQQEAAIRRAVEALLGGAVVALPTDTLYGAAACALVPEAVEQVMQLRGEGEPLALALASAEDALEWVPTMSALGRRLAKRCWPGPVTVVLAGVDADTVIGLPEPVRHELLLPGGLPLAVPGHDAFWQVLRLAAKPVVFAHLDCGSTPLTADQVCERFGDRVPLIVNGGPSRDTTGSTVVRVDGEQWKVVREGVVPPEEIALQAARMVVFVCTGNTCRSPMAEALCAKLVADRLGCTVPELPQRGYVILSAGVAALPGDPAAPEAIATMKEFGIDLQGHRSRPLTADLIVQADYLMTMTASHAVIVAERFRSLGPRPRRLGGERGDIADPIGCEQEVYRDCAQEIMKHLECLLPELL